MTWFRTSVEKAVKSLPLRWVGIVALCLGPAGRSHAQNVTVSPSPTPLDAKITITGSGFPSHVPVIVFWDNPNPTSTLNNCLIVAPNPDASGGFSFTLDQLHTYVYPATAGEHTLTFLFQAWDFQYYVVTKSITVTPRQGWDASPPLSTQPSPQMAAGTLAFLRASADGLSTSLVARGGANERVMGTAAVSAFDFGQPDWSPDGSRVAFSAVFDTYPHLNLFSMEASTGALRQLTSYGGSPPKTTGGGTGSVSGTIQPLSYKVPTSTPDEGTCGDVNDFPALKGAYLSLVGTNRILAAPIPPGGQVNAPIPFTITGIPEGDYSLHMWHYTTICQESTRPNPRAGQPGEKPTLIRHSRVIATPNATVPLHVDAGQTTQFQQAFQMVDLYYRPDGPSWMSSDKLVYTLNSGVYSIGGTAGLNEFWTVQPGQEAVKRSDNTANGPMFMSAATPAKGLIAGLADYTAGMFVADPATFPATLGGLTSWQAVMLASSNSTQINDAFPAWDPSGHYLAFVRLYPQQNLNVGNLWIHDVPTGKEKRVTNYDLTKGEGFVGRPAWSPDGSQIAATHATDDAKTHNLRIVNVADGSGFDLTTDGRSGYPSWTSAPLTNLPQAPAFNGPGLPDFNRQPGDVNRDSQRDIADAVLILRIIVGDALPDAEQKTLSDVNGDANTDVADAVALLRIIVGL